METGVRCACVWGGDKNVALSPMLVSAQSQKCQPVPRRFHEFFVFFVIASSHTCDETVLPGNGGQVVAVDVALKLEDFSGLKDDKVREREGQPSVRLALKENVNLMMKYTSVTLNKAPASTFNWKINSPQC